MRSDTPATSRLTRRDALKASGVALVGGALLAACDNLSAQPENQSGDDSGRPNNGKESPALAKLVEQGDLPSVEERLPEDPLVVEPTDRIGTYGGSWDAVMLAPYDGSWLDRTAGYEYLLRWKPDTVAHSLDDITTNVAQSYDVGTDGREYTFQLRAGMKWSDGEPFNADDILFAANEVLLNKQIYPSPPLGLLSGDAPATVEKLDDYNVRFTFAQPSPLFPHMLASKNMGLRPLTALPQHYLETFHADYNPDIDTLVEQENASDWVQLFSLKTEAWSNPDLPRLHAWVPQNSPEESTIFILDRNPYYWKVDPAGSQLPYLDTFSNTSVSDRETMVLKASNGEVDMSDRMINTLQNKPVFAQSREQGQYHFFDLRSGNMNTTIISLNLTHKDPLKREIFQNKDFRIGLSHAIHRDEIIKTVYKSLGEPTQAAPPPEWTYYDEQLAKQYTEFDLDRANEHLDRAGYSRQDGSGSRLGPDGSPILFSVEIATGDYGFDWASVMELVRGYWQRVGIEINVRPEDSSLLYTRKEANEHDAVVWQGDVGGLDAHLAPRYLFPYSHESNFGMLWQRWYQTRGRQGEEPPEATRRQMELYDQFVTTMDQQEQDDLMREIVTLARHQFYTIGICRPTGRYGIAHNNFHNVLNNYLEASNYPNPGPTNPEQYFTEE